MAAADCNGLWEKGYQDGVNYSLKELDYGALRDLAIRVEPLIEGSDPENIIAVLDEMKAFRAAYDHWDYKLGLVHGLLRLRAIAEMPERQYEREILGREP